MCISLATLSHANGLVEILELTDLDTKTRRNHLNAVKMTSYLLCQFVDVFEADVMRQATAVAHTAKVGVTPLSQFPYRHRADLVYAIPCHSHQLNPVLQFESASVVILELEWSAIYVFM